MTAEVTSFINDLEVIDAQKAAIVKELYTLFMQSSDALYDKFIYGGIGMYIGNTLIGGIYVSRHHVSLVFSRGNELKDEFGVLEGGGQFRRHIKLKTYDDISQKYCSQYIEQLIRLEK